MNENETMMENTTEVEETTTDLVPVETACECESEDSDNGTLMKLVAGGIIAGTMVIGYVVGDKVIKPGFAFCKSKWDAHKEKKAAEKAAKQEPVVEATATEVETPEEETSDKK